MAQFDSKKFAEFQVRTFSDLQFCLHFDHSLNVNLGKLWWWKIEKTIPFCFQASAGGAAAKKTEKKAEKKAEEKKPAAPKPAKKEEKDDAEDSFFVSNICPKSWTPVY